MASSDIIARRELEKDGRKYEVQIERPHLDEMGDFPGDYVCTWSLVDDSSTPVFRETLVGTDSLQALQVVFLVMGVRIAAESDQFTYLGRKDTGFFQTLDTDHPDGIALLFPAKDWSTFEQLMEDTPS